MVKRRPQSKIPANRGGGGSHRNGFLRGKKSCFFAICVVIGVWFSIRRTLNFRASLYQWSSLSSSSSVYAVMNQTNEAAENSGSFPGGGALITNFGDSEEASKNSKQDGKDNGKSIGAESDGSRSAATDQISHERNKEKSDEIIVSKNRTVLFLKRPQIEDGDPYSGMWWQDLEHFNEFNAAELGNLEGASFGAFRQKGGKASRVRMTRDWFDFAVEHLSMYHRHFNVKHEKTGIPFERIKSQLLEYIQKAKAYPYEKDAAPASTIVLCAFNVKKMLKGGPLYQTGENENKIRIHSLAATLASLWQVGMGRAVVVGGQLADEEAANVAFDFIRGKTNSSMELSFVISSNLTTGLDNNDLTPKQAIGGLQLALKGKFNASHTQEWLGGNPKRWKYVYFTEPDLILSSRPGSMQALTSQLHLGNILAAHRLQPIPHALDFPGFKDLSKVVPAVGKFSASAITDVNTAEYVCCDAGNFRPGRLMPQPECHSFWWQCGFGMRNKNYSDYLDIVDAHRRKVPYTWLKLSTGTGSVMMATTEHARQCTLIHHGSCEEAGPKKSVPGLKRGQAPVLHNDVILRTLEIAEANKALVKKESIPYRVTHLMRSSEFEPIDPNSGMWWQAVEGFMKFPNKAGSLEAASFAVNREKNTVMARDYLDFAVEDLRIYQHHFDVEQDINKIAYTILRKQMKGFMERAKQISIEENMAPRWTVAILPFTDNTSGQKQEAGRNKREIRIDALAATLASLWQFGIGRVVVVGKTQADEESANTAFDRLRASQPTVPQSMEFAFVVGPPNKKELVPFQAIFGLQMALQGHPNMQATDIENWLGAKHLSNATRWKYVYYSEPGLVLNSRALAIPTLTDAMTRGKMVAAHRLQPIPHALDFPGFDDQSHKTVPALGNFTHVYDMYSDKSACCDAGNGRPGMEIKQKECTKSWWQCGFNQRDKDHSNIADVVGLHVRKLPYTFIRLKTGTGITMMAATGNARMCSVVQYGTCEAE